MRGIYLKIVLGDWGNSSRDRRELSVASDLGYEIKVLASTKAGRIPYTDKVERYEVTRIPTRKFGVGKIRTLLGYAAGFCMFVKETMKIDACVISGHNYSGVIVGYLSQIFKKNKAKIIYDSHEFELYQKKRNIVAFCFVRILERFVISKSDITMMVCDSIADEVQHIYKLKTKPLVVRNIPAKRKIDTEKVQKNRADYMRRLNISESGRIIMYHGGLMPGRGIEETLQAVSRTTNVGFVLLGYTFDDEYEVVLHKMIDENGISDRVIFKDAVPFEDLYECVAAADIGIVLIQNTCASFFYSLPNKLFENIQANNPIIGSDFPEIGGIIDKYEIGIKIQPDDVDALVEAIEMMCYGTDKYDYYRKNVEIAQSELCWQKEEEKLRCALNDIGSLAN